MADENDSSRAAPRPHWRKRDIREPVAKSPPAKPRAKRHAIARAPKKSSYEGERVAKAIARAGFGSRRDAEGWIAQGRVAVNGQVLSSPAFNVVESDVITIDGKQISKRERTRLWLFHKPKGCITTESDPENRPTIFDFLPGELPRVVTVGRLDFNTEGLMLLTNDGGLARALELPTTGWVRRYRVRANGDVEQEALSTLKDGVTVDGVRYGGVDATLDRKQGANVWMTVSLREGKNREVKKILEHLALAVNRLIRISFGPFQLGDLAEGGVVEVRTRVLKDQIGETLAKEAGADFDAPLREAPPAEAIHGVRREVRRAAEHKRSLDGDDSKPATRKHVSALRSERDRDMRQGPRRRIERDATADRRGREVVVERLRSSESQNLARRGPGRRRRDDTGAHASEQRRPTHPAQEPKLRWDGALRSKENGAVPRAIAKKSGKTLDRGDRAPIAKGRKQDRADYRERSRQDRPQRNAEASSERGSWTKPKADKRRREDHASGVNRRVSSKAPSRKRDWTSKRPTEERGGPGRPRRK